MEVFRHCCPFQNSLQHELSSIIKAGTVEWFDRTYAEITKPRLRVCLRLSDRLNLILSFG